MTTWNPRANELFLQALELPDPNERQHYLDVACGPDEALRSEVDALLEASAGAGRFLESPVQVPELVPTVAEATVREGPGTIVGRYKLVEAIGEGGMGSVWMARQTEPVKRLVAVKLIKPGMDSKQVLARFEVERQVLALMDHPHIAKVLDAGAAPDGRPYFVMELVKGVPLTRYCDECRLTLRQRLELFVSVCQAVQHAHQKGIIHRDLKPSNVLVALYDDRPVVKVIDFGVAKATGQQLTEESVYTGFGAVVGTVEYMSPEQATLNHLDVDTRSDVYSLGVLLYELLTGTTPLEHQRVKEQGLLEALRLIREEEPPTLKQRLSTTQALAGIAARRGVESARLTKLVRGELDWIVMKCLEKNRSRRYETANSLAQDIQRYLDDEAVQACPPSVGYRLGKFARRHKRVLVPAALVLGAFLVAVVGLGYSYTLTLRTLMRERRSSYFQRTALAERELSSGNLARAEELLGQCPAELRGWEWHYLTRRVRGKSLPPLQHDNMAFCCAVSADGRLIASGDAEGVVYLWDARTGQELHRLRAPASECRRVAFYPDGKTLASAHNKGITLWDVASGKALSTWTPPAGSHHQDFCLGPDGRLLACTYQEADDSDARIWDCGTGQQWFALRGNRGFVERIALSCDGNLLASASHGKIVQVWEVATGTLVRTFHGDGTFRSVAFSPDGLLLAAGMGGNEGDMGSGQVKVWEVHTGRQRATLTGHGGRWLAFSPDGTRLASGGSDQMVKLWDTTSGQEVLTLRGHTDWVKMVVFSPDGQRLVSASDDRTVRIWDGRPWREGEPEGEAVLTLRHTDSVNAVAFRPQQGHLLATAVTGGVVQFWDTRTRQVVRTLRVEANRVEDLAFSPDGALLAAAGLSNGFVIVWDARGEVVRRLEHERVRSVAFSPDGRRLASAALFGKVAVWDVPTGQNLHWFTNASRYFYEVAFSPDPERQLVAVANGDGTVRIWDTATGKEIPQSPLKHQRLVESVAFSPDGKYLASGGGGDGAVHIWETATWIERQTFWVEGAPVKSLAFSPDGRWLAGGAGDATVRVWRLGTNELHTLRGHRNWVRRVVFSPDSTRIASASQDGTVKIWETPGAGNN